MMPGDFHLETDCFSRYKKHPKIYEPKVGGP